MSENQFPASLAVERALHLVMALDRARDALQDDEDPQTMFDHMAELLRTEFEADGCGLMLVSEISDDIIECLACAGLPQPVAMQLCREAIEQATPGPLADARWPHSLGVRIVLDDFPMGGLALVRQQRPFSPEEIALFALAESQIDSAVVLARTVWKLTQRSRELEAIYEIDRLRDRIAGEIDLVSGFTNIALQEFKAELCLVMLTHTDSGEMIVRSLVDQGELLTSALDAIRDRVSEIEIVQVIPSPPGLEDIRLLAAPFIVSSVRLGAVIVGRRRDFTIADHRMLHAMMSQMDSAVVFTRTIQQLAQRKQELEVIYRIDRIRDREKDFDAMLNAVLAELCQAVSSEMGYIMLYSAGQNGELELRSFIAGGRISSPQYDEILQSYSRMAVNRGEMVYANDLAGPVRSIVAVPLILNERIIGVFGALNSSHAGGFDAEDRRILAAITSQVDTAVFERLEQRRMRAVLSRSVDPKVLEHMLQHADTHLLSGERVVLTVLFADLRGSTEWAERTEPEELVATLNAFLGRMTDVIFKYGGTLDKFVGDEVIGLFGTPIPMPDHAYRAACAALEMQQIHLELQEAMRRQGRELPFVGVGVSSGEAIAGEFGHPIRSEFTALGRIINLGSRLCSAAQGGQVLISHVTYDMIHNLVEARALEPLSLKGIHHPAPVYELLSIRSA